MKQKNIYLQAAKHIDNKTSYYACFAIFRTCLQKKVYYRDFIQFFAEYFKPEDIQRESPWFGFSAEQENQEHRIMSLLLMHEIAKEI